MTVQIDKAGRIVLPKPIRDRLGLQAGVDIEIEETVSSIVLRPRDQKSALVKKDGLLVYTGEVPASFDAVRAIGEEREERMRKVWGT